MAVVGRMLPSICQVKQHRKALFLSSILNFICTDQKCWLQRTTTIRTDWAILIAILYFTQKLSAVNSPGSRTRHTGHRIVHNGLSKLLCLDLGCCWCAQINPRCKSTPETENWRLSGRQKLNFKFGHVEGNAVPIHQRSAIIEKWQTGYRIRRTFRKHIAHQPAWTFVEEGKM